MAELRSLQSYYPQYKDKISFVIISQDLNESTDDLRSFRDEQGWPWNIYRDSGQVLKDYKVLSQDTKLIIDNDGIIISRLGYRQTADWGKLLSSVTKE